MPAAAVHAVASTSSSSSSAAAAAAAAAAASAAPPPEGSWLWQSTRTSTHFAKAGPGKWVEVAEHGGEPVHFYEEQSTSLVREVVVLVDESRQMEVRLDPTHASFRAVRRGAGFEPFTQGRWATLEGQAAPAAPPAPPLKPPPPHLDGMTRATAKIFVGIAAHRDSMCGNTLKELFEHAKHPERIFPAVVQQNQPGDMDCIAQYCKLVGAATCRRGQVRIKRVDPAFVKGVMPARFASELMIRDETFCLQIDSHMATEDEWDMLAIDQFMRSGNEMAVLSTYPNRELQRHDQRMTPARCSAHFEGSGMPRGDSARNRPPSNSNGGKQNPDLVPFWGAGVSFSKCHADLMAPYDAHMAFLFSGEEFYHAARLFTHGYDVYAPAVNFVYHYYDDELPAYAKKDKVARRTFKGGEQREHEYAIRVAAERRVRVILGWPLADSHSSDAKGEGAHNNAARLLDACRSVLPAVHLLFAALPPPATTCAAPASLSTSLRFFFTTQEHWTRPKSSTPGWDLGGASRVSSNSRNSISSRCVAWHSCAAASNPF
jgi:hypothetical protein